MTTDDTDECTKESVSIHANYPFGNLAIETIELVSNKPKGKGKHRSIVPNNIIKASTTLELATIQTILDGIDAGDFGEICLHRKIAPYQCYVNCFTKGYFENIDKPIAI